MKKILLFLLISLGLFSCKTQYVYMTVTEPAPVTIPKYINKVGIVNRSKPSDDNKALNALDDVLSAKSPKLDSTGAAESIRGLKDELVSNSRFDTVLTLNSVHLTGPGGGAFPSPLSWDEVEKICKDNGVDAIFVLELFHTSTKVHVTTGPVGTNPNTGLPSIQYNASMATQVRTGWRIYDPQSKQVLDEYPMVQTLNFTGNGGNPVAATAALLNRPEAVKQTGYRAGQVYADRILPYNIRVHRDYFVKGNDNFKEATRMARTGNWDGAAKLWKKETTNSNRKIRGRACYNMAIINEINGDLDGAISWAQKAYEEDNIKLALQYVNILKDRKNDKAVLKNQQ